LILRRFFLRLSGAGSFVTLLSAFSAASTGDLEAAGALEAVEAGYHRAAELERDRSNNTAYFGCHFISSANIYKESLEEYRHQLQVISETVRSLPTRQAVGKRRKK